MTATDWAARHETYTNCPEFDAIQQVGLSGTATDAVTELFAASITDTESAAALVT
jgi:hypothetical protein